MDRSQSTAVPPEEAALDSNAIIAGATVVLVCVTAYYAYLTHRLASESKRANDFHRNAFERQLRAAIYPQLFCSAQTSSGETAVTIYNAGDNPAYDVDVIAITALSSEDIPVEKFVSEYVADEYRDEEKRIAERLMGGTFYGVFDHFVYPVFPPRRKVVVTIERSLPVDSIHLLLQFRDANGGNYAHYYWLMSDGGQNERFVLGNVSPLSAMITPRIDYHATRGFMELRVEYGAVPEEFSEIASLFAASVSSGITTAGRAGVEDPGEWSAL